MAATRTQVYLTEEQRRQVDALTATNGQSLAWVIREALDQYLAGPSRDIQPALDATFGALPTLSPPPRDEWDREPGGPKALSLPVPAPARATRGVRRRS